MVSTLCVLNLLLAPTALLAQGEGHARREGFEQRGVDDPEEVLRVDISMVEQDLSPARDVEGPSLGDPASREELRRLCREHGSFRPPRICADFVDPDPRRWVWEDSYFMLGMAPAVTFVPGALHPNLRYDLELGMDWAHPRKRRSVTVGVDAHIFHLLDRRRPGGGADLVVGGSLGPVVLRGGLGVLGGLPFGPDPTQTRPAVGGLVGVGLRVGDGDWGGRITLDYDLRVDRGLVLSHTVLLSARFFWGV